MGLALRQRLAGGAATAMWECVRPALAAGKPTGFLRELSRRLPVFAVLHAKYLEEVGRLDLHETDHALISQGYAELEGELVRWGDGLDEITRAELDLAIATLRRSNETLLQATTESRGAETADLFRTAVLVEFLLFCLLSLALSGEHPRIAEQIVYSLKYAALDHAAAVRACAGSPARIEPPVAALEPDDREDTFWALVGTLPLVEIGDPS